MSDTRLLIEYRCTHGPDAVCNICIYDRERRLVAFNAGAGMFTGPDFPLSGLVQEWLQRKPWPLWLVGNALSTLRFLLWRAAR